MSRTRPERRCIDCGRQADYERECISRQPSPKGDVVMAEETSNYVSFKKLSEYLGDTFTIDQLRWLLRDRDSNGLGPHVTKIGRRLIIKKSGFLEWLDEHFERRLP